MFRWQLFVNPSLLSSSGEAAERFVKLYELSVLSRVAQLIVE